MRVLLLEDHDDTRVITARLLRHLGHTVETFADGEETAAYCEKGHALDLLISDIGLPGESGLTVLNKLRDKHKPFKAIAMTAFARDDDIAQCRDAGFDGCVTKPFSLKVLEDEIAMVCLEEVLPKDE